jgi:hypothetical protein
MNLVEPVRLDIEAYNPLLHHYHTLAQFSPQSRQVYLELADPGSGPEIAALYHVGNATRLGAKYLSIAPTPMAQQGSLFYTLYTSRCNIPCCTHMELMAGA